MNSIVGSITFKWDIELTFSDVKFYTVKNLTLTWDTNVYFYGRTSLNSSKEFVDYASMSVGWEILAYDISITSEDTLKIYTEERVEGEYMVTSLSWIHETFDSALEKFEGSSPSIIAIREAEKSQIFWNKVIKVDIIY